MVSKFHEKFELCYQMSCLHRWKKRNTFVFTFKKSFDEALVEEETRTCSLLSGVSAHGVVLEWTCSLRRVCWYITLYYDVWSSQHVSGEFPNCFRADWYLQIVKNCPLPDDCPWSCRWAGATNKKGWFRVRVGRDCEEEGILRHHPKIFGEALHPLFEIFWWQTKGGKKIKMP